MISVIVPSLNEAARLPGLLQGLLSEATKPEVIVVDGGSQDATRDVARQGGAKVVVSAPGRGQQLAKGAAEARGDILLFLHADCIFPSGGLTAIEQAFCGAA